MDTDTNPVPKDSAAVESKDDSESFTKVKSKKTQKRKREQDGVGMDTEEPVATKRPQFPPISGDKLKVTTVETVCVLSQRCSVWMDISIEYFSSPRTSQLPSVKSFNFLRLRSTVVPALKLQNNRGNKNIINFNNCCLVLSFF